MPEGKHFFIKTKMNGLVMDVKGESGEPGTHIIMWDQKEGMPANQLWTMDYKAKCIRSHLNHDLCLCINDDNKLVLDHYDGDDERDMQWIIVGDQIQSRSDSNRVLDVVAADSDEGTKVCAWEAHGGDNQRWEFEYQQAPVFRIHSEMNNKVITCRDGKLKMFDDEDCDEQLWYEDKHGVLCCKANDMCMSSRKGCGKKVKMEHFEEGVDEHMWFMSGNKIINLVVHNHVLDIKGQNYDDGAKVIVWEDNDQENQHWDYHYV